MSEPTSNRNREPYEPLDPEDDWFATVADEPSAPVRPEEPVWQDEPFVEPYEPPPPGLGRRQIAVVLAVLVAVVAAGAVIVAIRAIGGDSGGGTGTPTVTTTQTPTGGSGTTATTPTGTGTGTTTTPSTSKPGTATGSVPTGTTLRPGDSGDSVTSLQKALKKLGFDPGTVDGKYGAATEQAVKAFQQSNSLSADGIAGPKTIAAINQALAGG